MYIPLSASEAVKNIKSNDNVYIHTAGAAPQTLINAMVARSNELKNVNTSFYHVINIQKRLYFIICKKRNNINIIPFF